MIPRPLLYISVFLLTLGRFGQPFVQPARTRTSPCFVPRPLWSTSTEAEEIESMRAGEIKKELESYGIGTKSFLEKKELVAALKDAREKGLEPKKTATTTTSTTSSTTSSDSASRSTSSSATTETTTDTRPREERLKEEMEKCQAMKATELKKELQERGISTKSLFEKTEFVKAAAEARVDGVQQKKKNEEGYAEYTNVEVLTDENAGPRKKQSEQQSSSPFGGGSSPFGGGAGGANPFADMMGGMGGMGGITDMLKNMGGAAGGSPFGGAAGGGGSPFGGGMGGMGDAMGKAQEMMKNPKVQEILAKAQSNPRIMQKVNECMGNPASFAKYQNDPDVKELITELRKYM